MAQIEWTKGALGHQSVTDARSTQKERIKFIIGGLLMVGAVVYLLISGTLGGVRYFITVDELVSGAHPVGQSVRITGAVIGESIVYDAKTLDLSFAIANVPIDTPDLALALHQAVLNPSTARLTVYMHNQVKPDLLRNEAQAILTGYLGDDGRFYGDSVLLKCPSRFGDAKPDDASVQNQAVDSRME